MFRATEASDRDAMTCLSPSIILFALASGRRLSSLSQVPTVKYINAPSYRTYGASIAPLSYLLHLHPSGLRLLLLFDIHVSSARILFLVLHNTDRDNLVSYATASPERQFRTSESLEDVLERTEI